MALASRSPSSMPRGSLYEIVSLYSLADRNHLNKYCRPISSITRLPSAYGPVPALAYDLPTGRLCTNNVSWVSLLSLGKSDSFGNVNRFLSTSETPTCSIARKLIAMSCSPPLIW